MTPPIPKSPIDKTAAPRLIKCVVWDLDNTLWHGIAVEAEDADRDAPLPTPDPAMLKVMGVLEARGILNSVASRNDPALQAQLGKVPDLTGRFVAPQVGWEPKSTSLKNIAHILNIGMDALAFVDDSAFERAEVAFLAPEVLVLSPDQIEGALSAPEFGSGTTATEEARNRSAMYLAEERRKAAEAGFGGTRTEFLRWCDMRLVIAPTSLDDLPRLAEMTARTHQLNSTGTRYTEEQLRALISSPDYYVPAARLTDRFGDYGLIGAAVVQTASEGGPEWYAELVMLSCRVEGRGIPAALLRSIMDRAREAGAAKLRASYRINERNLPIRLLFRQMGLTTLEGSSDGLVYAVRDLGSELPPYPEWLRIEKGDGPHG